MKRFWDRPERMLDALVIAVALPTIAIAASLGAYELRRDEGSRGRDLQVRAGEVRFAGGARRGPVRRDHEDES